jgi:hypothetical protein
MVLTQISSLGIPAQFHGLICERRNHAMPPGRTVLFLLLVAPLAGCLTAEPSGPSELFSNLNGFQSAPGPDLIHISVAILEVGVGDPYLNEELWTMADEQQLLPERKAVLRENGFRIGQIRGITPPGLQALLTSDRCNPNPRLKQARAGDACTVSLGPCLEHCRFQLREDVRPTHVDMTNAQTALEIVATITEDGYVRLAFRPQIEPGGLPSQRLSGLPLWMVLTQPPCRKIDTLAWDVTLQPNEYVIIGGRLEQTDSLGQRCFLGVDEPRPVQRLLVIRTARVLPEVPLDDSTRPRDEAESLKQMPPLALRAAWPTPRGSAP